MLPLPPSPTTPSNEPQRGAVPTVPTRGKPSFAERWKRLGALTYAFLVARYVDCIQIAVRRPLVIFFRNGGVGDILCTFPAAARIVSDHPTAYTIYCTHPDFVSLPKAADVFDRVLGIKMSDLVSSMIAARHVVYRFSYPDEKANDISTSYLADEFSVSSGLTAKLPWPILNLGELSPRVANLFRGSTLPVICIHTGPTWNVREWPLENWDALVARLHAQTAVRVLQIGASRHFTEGARVEHPVEGTEDLRDRFSLLESLQIISQAHLMIAIDSGLIHGAVALDVPVIGLFGPTAAKLRLPQRFNVSSLSTTIPCLGCHHRLPRLHWQSGCPHDIRCMRELRPGEVFNEAIKRLETWSGAGTT